MQHDDFRPPSDVRCPTCGAEATWQPPARRTAGDAWEADFVCGNRHRLTLFSKPKQRASPDEKTPPPGEFQ